MKFVHFTDGFGRAVPIVPTDVVELRPADEATGEARGIKTIILLSNGQSQGVRESPSEIEAKLKDE